jgi:hypothetical protein
MVSKPNPSVTHSVPEGHRRKTTVRFKRDRSMNTVEHRDNGKAVPKTPVKKEGRLTRWRLEDLLDRTLEDTFPCSDPLSSLRAD